MLRVQLVLSANVFRSYQQQESYIQNEFVSHKTQNGSVILNCIVRVCCALNNVIECVILLCSHAYNYEVYGSNKILL